MINFINKLSSFWILIILINIIFIGCKTSKSVVGRTFDSTMIKREKKAHVVKGGEVSIYANVRPVFRDHSRDISTDLPKIHPYFINEKDTNITRIVRESDNGRARLELLIDSLGNVVARCKAKDSIIYSKNETIHRLRDQESKHKESRYKAKVPWWAWLIIGGGTIGGFFIGTIFVKKIPFI